LILRLISAAETADNTRTFPNEQIDRTSKAAGRRIRARTSGFNFSALSRCLCVACLDWDWNWGLHGRILQLDIAAESKHLVKHGSFDAVVASLVTVAVAAAAGSK